MDDTRYKDPIKVQKIENLKSIIFENQKFSENPKKTVFLYSNLIKKYSLIRGLKSMASKIKLKIKNQEKERTPETIKNRAKNYAKIKIQNFPKSAISPTLPVVDLYPFNSLPFRAFYRLSIMR